MDYASPRRGHLVSSLLVLWSALSLVARADGPNISQPPDGKPLWEFGLFNGVASMPYYPGSDENSVYVLPLPYLVYRGEVLRANRSGVGGIFVDRGPFDLRLSLSGNPPVPDDCDAREGMEDLGPVVEIGPSARFYLLRDKKRQLYLSAAVRQVIAFESGSLRSSAEGLRSRLEFVYHADDLLGDGLWSLGTRIGAHFGNSVYHAYFYSVADADTRDWRPAYDAPSGYGGCSASVGVVRRLSDSFALGGYIRWDNLSGAAYADSPLVRRENNLMVGCALIWTVARSRKTVTHTTGISNAP